MRRDCLLGRGIPLGGDDNVLELVKRSRTSQRRQLHVMHVFNATEFFTLERLILRDVKRVR